MKQLGAQINTATAFRFGRVWQSGQTHEGFVKVDVSVDQPVQHQRTLNVDDVSIVMLRRKIGSDCGDDPIANEDITCSPIWETTIEEERLHQDLLIDDSLV